MVLGRFLWFFMGKNLQKLNWHGTDACPSGLGYQVLGLITSIPSSFSELYQ